MLLDNMYFILLKRKVLYKEQEVVTHSFNPRPLEPQAYD